MICAICAPMEEAPVSRVTLVNPNRMKPGVAPIALEYLAESLAAAGHRVEILDLCFSDNWQADADAHFASSRPDLIGMTIRNTDDCYFASQDFFVPFYKEVVSRIKSLTEAPVVLGGAGLSVSAPAIVNFTGADYAIVGEGEVSLVLLAEALDRAALSGIPGLVYRDGGAIVSNPPQWMDMADLPIRSRRWLDNRRYFEEGGQAGIETKRGCDGTCIYCADPLGKGRICRLRPPAHVISEIRALLDQGIDCFHLCDAEFNMPISHAEAVCREIIASGLAGKFRWYAYASAAPFTDELADLMVRAGCVGIDFGADHGDDLILKTLGRDFTSDDVRRTAEICHRHGITFMYDLLIGGPRETFDSVRTTIDLMKEISPSRVGVSVGVRIYNGTGLANMVRSKGISTSNPCLHGAIEGNDNFLLPIYYISPEVGLGVMDFISTLVEGDPRFLHATPDQLDGNYNYNDNSVLVQAIKAGYRGAYWDTLRRIHEGLPPSSNPKVP